MINRTIKKNLIVLLLLTVLNVSIVYADWQSDLEAVFDHVSTFDELQDWRGTQTGSVTDLNDMPKLHSGERGAWGWYSYWRSYPSIQDWITNHGAGNAWSGTKSLCMDISGDGESHHSAAGGPSRLGMYVGDGTPESGYKDMYVFHMVKIPKNEFPTNIADDLEGTYIEGDPYVHYDSWKFGTANMGCKVPFCDQTGDRATYSDFHIIPHIKVFEVKNNNPAIKLEPLCLNTGRGGVISNVLMVFDEWIGFEYHFWNVAEDGSTYGHMTVWQYDSVGNATLAIDDYRWKNTSQPITDLWNVYFLGGNNSNTYHWGPTMEPWYYVDDFIIHGSRIGPTYFALLSGSQPPPPQHDIKPQNVQGSILP